MIRFSNIQHLQDYLLKAALGHAPIPISQDNLAKAYAHFKGARAKDTVLKITSRLDILLNLVPQVKEILPRVTEEDLARLHTFIDENALHEFAFNLNSAAEVRQALLNLRDEQYRLLSRIFRNPDQVTTALHSSTKKEWINLLEQQPQTSVLMAASANLSSEDFFSNHMHLAFMELEPEIYGSIHAGEAQHCFEIGRLYRKEIHLRALATRLEQEEASAQPPLTEEEVEQHAEAAKEVALKPHKEHPEEAPVQPEPQPVIVQETAPNTQAEQPRQPKHVYKPAQREAKPQQKPARRPEPVELPELPKEEKKEPLLSTYTKKRKLDTNINHVPDINLEGALAKEFGTNVALSQEQTEALLQSAKEILFPEKVETAELSGNFLHKSKPLPKKKPLTFDTIDLSSKKS